MKPVHLDKRGCAGFLIKKVNKDNKMQSNATQPKCIIISAGTFVPLEIPINEGDYVIACDAGFKYAQQLGILPDLIVGDFDSASEAEPDVLRGINEIKEHDPDRVVQLEVRKDDTDTIKAVKIALSKGYRKFYMYGTLGGKRFDHTIANIQTLLYIKHNGGRGYIFDADRMIMIAENEAIKFHKGNTGYISVFSLSERALGVTLRGLMYNLENGELKNDFPLGVSNEFIIDEEAEISVKDGTLLIITEFQ